MVEIVGPETHVRQVENATTEPVSIAGATSPVREMATIGVGDSAVRLTQVQTADVTIGIVPAPVQVVLDHVPVRWRNLGTGLKAELAPQFASVTARGGAEILHRLAPDSVVAFVDLAGLGAGRYNLRVQTVPAADYGVTAIEPATAAVTIR
jgi:YbbR domain-containing protein